MDGDEAAGIIALANKTKVAYARRAPFEMIEGEMAPRNLRIGRKALDAVFGAMRDAGLADKNTPWPTTCASMRASSARADLLRQ
jgi:hypothetical protein